jgi:hypothetical protein
MWAVAAALHSSRAVAGGGLRRSIMGTAMTSLEASIDKAINELETVTDEIRVKLHLAGMDANVVWKEKMEPRLFDARAHASEARVASRHAIEDAVKAFKAFAASL